MSGDPGDPFAAVAASLRELAAAVERLPEAIEARAQAAADRTGEPSEWMSPAQAAAFLGVPVATIRQWQGQGLLSRAHVGGAGANAPVRIPTREVRAFVISDHSRSRS